MKKTVLLCDKDPHIYPLYCGYLNSDTIDLIFCDHPSKLLSLAINIHPDLILINTELSSSNGYQQCKRLKQNNLTLMIPVILLSDAPCVEQRLHAMEVGALDLVPRVASSYFLQERVNNVLFEKQYHSLAHRSGEQHFHVLVAEDSPSLQQFYYTVLSANQCEVALCDDGHTAWKYLRTNDEVDLIIVDLHMPNMNGKELCNLIRSHYQFDQIPIMVVSTETEKSILIDLLNQGVNDYILKPFHEAEIRARVLSHLRSRSQAKEQARLNSELIELSAMLEDRIEARTQEVFDANIEAIYKLSTACDLKDTDTANHIARVRQYVETFSKHLGIDDQTSRVYGYSSMMHDVGKLGIPDAVLAKPGPLNEEEWAVMRTHPIKGKEILGNKPFYRHAADIALGHHERFDGSGYPYGLKGNQNPLSARIASIVDIYDALRSKRSYKPAWCKNTALTELKRLAGSHLDPKLTDEFLKLGSSHELDAIEKSLS